MANTYTSNLNLAKPDKGDVDWDDEVNGNADTLDVALGTEHRTDGSHKNTVRIGDGANSEDKKIVARTGAANEPYVLYDVSEGRFILSNDGVNSSAVVTEASTVLEVAPSGKPYSTISAALSHAQSGDVILVYPGIYTLSAELAVNTAVKIVGIGMPIIQFNAGAGNYVVNLNAAATLKGLNISMTGTAGGGPVRIASSGVTIEDCSMDNNGASGCCLECHSGSSTVKQCSMETSYGVGVSVENGTHVFAECSIVAISYGVEVADNAALTVTLVACEVYGGASASAIHLVDSANNHTLICRRCLLKKGSGATYTVTESSSGSSGRIYHCHLNAAVNITNDITTPYNVVDANV